MALKQIRYGGSMCDKQEERAIIKSVKESIKSGNWQCGVEGSKMEQEACKTLGVKYGILTNSGSSAGLLALSALELPKGSEVIISAVTFPTIFNIILQCGLVPVVVDAKIGSYTFDIDEVEQAISEKTKAIIAIHPVGNPVDMPKLMKVAKRHKIKVIEDCCDTWGGSIKGKMLGSFGDVSITSFHAAHIVSMGVGGGVFTNNKQIAQNVRMYRDWGRQANTDRPHTCKTLPADYNPRFVYDKIGYNFQILELQAVMGRIQLRKAKKIKALRTKNFNYLVKHLSKHEDLTMPKVIKGADVCWFALPITVGWLDDEGMDTEEFVTNKYKTRARLVKYLEANGIETRSMFAGNIIRHPAYKNTKYRIVGNLRHSDIILGFSFWIGVHPRMTKKDLDFVISVFDKFYAEN